MASASSEVRKGRYSEAAVLNPLEKTILLHEMCDSTTVIGTRSRTIKLIMTSSIRTLRLSADAFLSLSSTKYGRLGRTTRKERFPSNKATTLRLLYELDSTCGLLNLVMIAVAPCDVVVVKPLAIITLGEPLLSPSSSWLLASAYNANNLRSSR